MNEHSLDMFYARTMLKWRIEMVWIIPAAGLAGMLLY